ncbi:MAG TPA: ribonuclease J [Xanthobacteraceae bacterium]|nr:ribonuclease J [Xanthobacteraceae bacterium]
MTKPQQEILFAPLGGVGEIGMNLALYGLASGNRREWLCVDMGVSFGDSDTPGVDLIMADVSFAEEERRDLKGIVITHGHEDHVGALFALWPKLKVPVYATPFTATLIESKRMMEHDAPEIPITVVPVGGRVTIGSFDVEFVPVAHSIPESHSLAIRTPVGTVVHTGDWKIDPTPVVGEITDERKFRAIGEEGVRAVVCDSTNAVREGISPSEQDVAETLKTIIAEAKGRVAITTFASNLARLRSAALAAEVAGRTVVVVGRAMERVIGVGRELGYLDGVPPFRGVDAYGSLPANKVLVLLTGSQGEPRAALARIANDDHPAIELSPGDLLIMSARSIPGNEKAINRIINSVIDKGVEVLTDRDALVHVSGHPRRGELKQMFGWLRPEVVVPVHGEALHLHENAELAREAGIKEVVSCRNGDIVRLWPGPAGIVDQFQAGRLYKDGSLLVSASEPAVKDRKRLSFSGVISIAVAMEGRGAMADEPVVEFAGIPEHAGDHGSMLDLILDAIHTGFEGLPKPRRRDPDQVEEAIRRSVRGAVNAAWGKKPTCHVLVLQI